jgi:stage II sporulation protein D
VKSLAFEMRPVRDGWLIAGKGYGHGVGLCQWGADGMARAGKGYRDILARYYLGTSLSGGDA